MNDAKLGLKNDVFPLWFEKGIDRIQGGFIENLSFNNDIPDMPRRAMVQARQIYSFLTGYRMGLISKDQAYFAVDQGVDYLVKNFSLPSGGFAYSIHSTGTIAGAHPDLYTQAFALFALAQSYSIHQNQKVKSRAQDLVSYLYLERLHNGGFTELDADLKISFKSNQILTCIYLRVPWHGWQ